MTDDHYKVNHLVKDTLDSILTWFGIARPKKDIRNQTNQLGVHFEEFAEMLEALSKGQVNGDRLGLLTHQAHKVATMMKQGEIEIDFTQVDRIEFLDSLCDQIVTAAGVAYTQNMDIHGALEEVDSSNWSKFIDNKPIYDEHGKVLKGPNYFKAALDRFV